jgi:hypothetical protein
VTQPFPLITRRPESLRRAARAQDRRDVLDRLRRMAMLAETAQVLEQRAGRVRNPAVAAALRTCAADRRQAAEQLRAHLAAHGVLVARPRPAARAAQRSA